MGKTKLKLSAFLVTLFVLSGNVGYSTENNGAIINSESLTGIKKDPHWDPSKIEYQEHKDFGNNIETKEVNNGFISGSFNFKGVSESVTDRDISTNDKIRNSGNGYLIKNNNINAGTIMGNASILGVTLNSAQYRATLGGRNFTYSLGNGISNNLDDSQLGLINNRGMIKGNIKTIQGTLIATSNTLGALLGEIITISSGNGVNSYTENSDPSFSYLKSSISQITNSGNINGEILTIGGLLQSNEIPSFGNGSSSNYLNIISTASGNGINIFSSNGLTPTNINATLENELTKLDNSGKISGEVVLEGGIAKTDGSASTNANVQSVLSGNGVSLSSNGKGKRTIVLPDFLNKGLLLGKADITGSEATMNWRNEPHVSVASAGTTAFGSGNGIFLGYNGTSALSAVNLLNSTNDGTISGYLNSKAGIAGNTNFPDLKIKESENLSFSGNGISVMGGIDSITNNGIIKGSQSAIAALAITTVKNYGLLAGREIYSNGAEVIANDRYGDYNQGFQVQQKILTAILPTVEENYGVTLKLKSEIVSFDPNPKPKPGHYPLLPNFDMPTGKVTLDANGNPIIETITNGTGGVITLSDGTQKTVLNGAADGSVSAANTTITTGDSYLLSSNLTNNDNLIINSAGINEGALVVNVDTTLKNSIINGYNAALYLENDKKFVAENVTFNGGGLKSDQAVIKGSNGNNEVLISGSSIINGKIDLGAGDDKLSISNTVLINGDLEGGIGTDILNLGASSTAKTENNLNIFHTISGFETLNSNGNITLFETAKVTGASTINLETGNLNLRIDPTIKDVTGNIIGHSLYENNGTLSSTTGKLVIGLNGIGENSIVGMGGTQINTNFDTLYSETDKLITNSLVLDATLLANGNVMIGVLDYLPLPVDPEPPVDPETPVDPPITVNGPLYEKLNKIYKSIVSAGEIGVLANTTLINTGIGNSYLETINGGIASSRDEALGELLVILDQMYANNPYSYTLKSSRDSMKTFEDNLSYLTIKPNEKEWIIQGRAIYTGVKGDNGDDGKNYHGFDTGHRNYKTTTKTIGGLASFEYGLSNDSSVGFAIGGNNQDIKLKGSSEIDGNSLYLGVFAKKEIKNLKFMGGIGYQYSSLDTEREVFNKRDFLKTSDNYDVNTLSTFIEGKYVLDAGDNLKVEPKIRLSYYHVAQDGIDEGYTPNNLEMSVNKAEQDTLDLEVGVDFVKTANFKSGKLNGVLTLAAINTFGDKDESLTGRINGKNKTGSDFEIQGTKLESLSGKVGLNLEYEHTNGLIYTVGTDFEFSQNNNRNISGKVGLGYRF